MVKREAGLLTPPQIREWRLQVKLEVDIILRAQA